jgi:hypothetical protein
MRITLLMPLALVALAGSNLHAMKPASTPSTPATGRAAAAPAAVAKDKVEARVVTGLAELGAVGSAVEHTFADAFKRAHPNVIAAIPSQLIEATLKVIETKHPQIVDSVMQKLTAVAGHRGLNVSAEALDLAGKLASVQAELSSNSAALDAFGEVVQGLLPGLNLPAVGTQVSGDLQVMIQNAVKAGLADLDQAASSGCGKKGVKK